MCMKCQNRHTEIEGNVTSYRVNFIYLLLFIHVKKEHKAKYTYVIIKADHNLTCRYN